MIIPVVLHDDLHTIVSREGLNRLLERGLVKRFKRGSGWAVVGLHPIRIAHDLNVYSGPERRLNVRWH